MRVIATVCIVAAFACALACQRQESGTEESTDLSGIQIVESAEQVVATPSPISQRCDVGYLIVPHDGFLVFDPTQETVGIALLYGEVYSGLTRLNPETGDLEPDLAESYDVTDDGLAYTFRLRDDLRFSDGTPVEPSDIQFSWARALGPELKSPLASSVLGNIVGADEVIAGEATELSGFVTVDPTTIDVRMVRPDAEFPAKLAHRAAYVLSEENVRQWEDEWIDPWSFSYSASSWSLPDLPVGTGPFRVTSYGNFSNRVTFVPNEFHWNEAGRAAQLAITQQYWYSSDSPGKVSDEDPDVIVYESQLIDLAEFDIIEVRLHSIDEWHTLGGIEGASIEDAEALGYALVQSERLPEVSFMAFNTAVPPFEDVEFRRALVASADTAQLNYREQVANPRRSAAGLIPPGAAGYVQRELTEADETTAGGHMTQSGYADSADDQVVRIQFVGAFNPFDYETVSRNWRAWFGIEVLYGFNGGWHLDIETGASTAKVDDSEEVIISLGPDDFESHNVALESGTLQTRFVEVQPTRNSAEEVLGLFRNLFGPNAVSPEVEELNVMLDAAAAEPDAAKRAQLYTELEHHILDRALAIPIAWGGDTKYEIVREWIDGFDPSPYGGMLLHGVTVDTSHPDYPTDRPCN